MFFFVNDTATTEIYTLSLHDALPIWGHFLRQGRMGVHQHSLEVVRAQLLLLLQHLHDPRSAPGGRPSAGDIVLVIRAERLVDRKSTRLNSSHANISYAVFCLKKKKQQ